MILRACQSPCHRVIAAILASIIDKDRADNTKIVTLGLVLCKNWQGIGTKDWTYDGQISIWSFYRDWFTGGLNRSLLF